MRANIVGRTRHPTLCEARYGRDDWEIVVQFDVVDATVARAICLLAPVSTVASKPPSTPCANGLVRSWITKSSGGSCRIENGAQPRIRDRNAYKRELLFEYSDRVLLIIIPLKSRMAR